MEKVLPRKPTIRPDTGKAREALALLMHLLQ